MLIGLRQLLLLNYSFIKGKIRDRREYRKQPDFETSIFKKKEVLHGLFKGLKYPGFEAVCSSIYPKLLGSYEFEIQNELKQLIELQPSLIIDIGSAEGYYAIGLAKLLPDSKVVAVDISSVARKLCAQLAYYNNCDNVSIIEGICSDDLLTYNLKDALIICDCEGYEMELFNENNISNFTNTSLVVETHDFINLSISGYIEKLFEKTHHIKVIQSIDDIQKAKYYRYCEFQGLTLHERKLLIAEYRPSIMEWLILTPKKGDNLSYE